MIRQSFLVFITLVSLPLYSFVAEAKNHGTKGATWEIAEIDLLEFIESKLKSMEANGELEMHQNRIRHKILSSIKEPEVIKGIVRATRDHEYYFDPTLVVNEDIKDHRGRIIAKKGQRVNPLEKMPYKQHLIFIDGRDDEQVSWYIDNYLNEKQEHKLILVGGKPFDLMQNQKLRVYYDQSGFITGKLGIKAVPSVAKQEGLRIQITEINIKDTSTSKEEVL